MGMEERGKTGESGGSRPTLGAGAAGVRAPRAPACLIRRFVDHGQRIQSRVPSPLASHVSHAAHGARHVPHAWLPIWIVEAARLVARLPTWRAVQAQIDGEPNIGTIIEALRHNLLRWPNVLARVRNPRARALVWRRGRSPQRFPRRIEHPKADRQAHGGEAKLRKHTGIREAWEAGTQADEGCVRSMTVRSPVACMAYGDEVCLCNPAPPMLRHRLPRDPLAQPELIAASALLDARKLPQCQSEQQTPAGRQSSGSGGKSSRGCGS